MHTHLSHIKIYFSNDVNFFIASKCRKQEKKGTTEDEMVGQRHRLKGHEFE